MSKKLKANEAGPSGPVCITFCLLARDRKLPHKMQEFTGVFEGQAVILTCTQRPELNNQEFTLNVKNIVSVSTAFIYYAEDVRVTRKVIYTKASVPVYMKEHKAHLNAEDLAQMVGEVGGTPAKLEKLSKLCTTLLQKTRGRLETKMLLGQVPAPAGAIEAAVAKLRDAFRSLSDVFRLPDIQEVSRCFLPGSQDEDAQRLKIRKLDSQQLEMLLTILCNSPWLLVFRPTLRLQVGTKLKPLSLKGFQVARERFHPDVPHEVELAIQLYGLWQEDREQHGHTLFYWQSQALTTALPITERQWEPRVKEFLQTNEAIVWLSGSDTTQRFALSEDYAAAQNIQTALQRVHANARCAVPRLRDPQGVPKIPPKLTGDQTKVAQHILNHCITLVEGLPGTGKTALIEWAVSYFATPLLCTFTGMMTKSLQKRNGRRPEVAHTIDSLICKAKFVPNAKAWLAKFDVLIVDEISNTQTNKMAKLLPLLPSLVRIIAVGDYQQIRSMGAGDLMCDWRSVFPVQTLTVNLRVDPGLEDLYQCPALIASGKHTQLNWSTQGPLRHIQLGSKDVDMDTAKETLRNLLIQCLQRKRALMYHHIIVCTNRLRKQLNMWAQETIIERKLIDGNGFCLKIGQHTFYLGSKLTFTKNYNRPSHFCVPAPRKGQAPRSLHGMPVANGDVGVITHMERVNADVIYLEFTDNDYDPADASTKSVIIGRRVPHAVDPIHVDLGYASTTTKIQGREAPVVIFWHTDEYNKQWTRSHAYVALSRGKQMVTYVGLMPVLHAICAKLDVHRRTVLYHLLRADTFKDEGYTARADARHLGIPLGAYKVLLPTLPCVPVCAEEEEEKEDNE